MVLLFNVLCLFIVAQFTLFGFFLVNHPKGHRTSNNILAVFLFTYALFALYVPLLNNLTGLFVEYRIYFYRITEPLRFLFGPLLYFYTVSLTSRDFRFKKNHLWHAVPFVINVLVLVVFFHSKSYEARADILTSDTWFATRWQYFNFYFFYGQFVMYLLTCLIKIKKYQKNLKDYFSSLERIKLSWLRIIIIAYLLTWGVNLLNILIHIKTFSMTTYMGMAVFSTVVIFGLANTMIFKGLRHPHLFIQPRFNIGNEKYKKSPLTPALKTRYLERLIEHIDREKPYLNFNLTLGELSHQSKIPVNYLSQVINEVLEKNFYTFINEYRIKEAIQRLSDPRHKNKPILEILFEVGFNSKSTFYTFFHKITGTTPSVYRKQINLSDSKV